MKRAGCDPGMRVDLRFGSLAPHPRVGGVVQPQRLFHRHDPVDWSRLFLSAASLGFPFL